MDWWQAILLYLGIWVLGLVTGFQAGVGAALLRITRQQQQAMPAPGGPDLAMLTKMMNSQAGVPR